MIQTSRRPQSGPQWVHEIKHDGYRLIARKDGDQARLWSRTGRNWAASFTAITAALISLPVNSVVLDGEAVAHCDHGLPDFHRLSGDGPKAKCQTVGCSWLAALYPAQRMS